LIPQDNIIFTTKRPSITNPCLHKICTPEEFTATRHKLTQKRPNKYFGEILSLPRPHTGHSSSGKNVDTINHQKPEIPAKPGAQIEHTDEYTPRHYQTSKHYDCPSYRIVMHTITCYMYVLSRNTNTQQPICPHTQTSNPSATVARTQEKIAPTIFRPHTVTRHIGCARPCTLNPSLDAIITVNKYSVPFLVTQHHVKYSADDATPHSILTHIPYKSPTQNIILDKNHNWYYQRHPVDYLLRCPHHQNKSLRPPATTKSQGLLTVRLNRVVRPSGTTIQIKGIQVPL
jgi:hypothetical protein